MDLSMLFLLAKKLKTVKLWFFHLTYKPRQETIYLSIDIRVLSLHTLRMEEIYLVLSSHPFFLPLFVMASKAYMCLFAVIDKRQITFGQKWLLFVCNAPVRAFESSVICENEIWKDLCMYVCIDKDTYICMYLFFLSPTMLRPFSKCLKNWPGQGGNVHEFWLFCACA